eukprot:TRINITY_DN26545_c0_g1_i1.p1 TRINITY_DN26545_c0_g1~~TRINITY_DN26545_c0_g1_i1.p1  ORF type:complete len:688 (+),score=117.64 TRINITY_DN26545_c0_g1_i1:132-2195(+)
MTSATKVLLETIQVARHISRAGLRPLEKGAVQAARVGEDLAFWTLRLQPVEEFLGKGRTNQILDSYLHTKEVVGSSMASLSSQSWRSAMQGGCQLATVCLRKVGIRARVIGPLDEHWNTLRVIRDLREETSNGQSRGNITPKRFVQFMREAEKRKKRMRGRDPIESYVEWMLSSGSFSRIGPMFLEKKLYADVARIMCFAFDRALMEANGIALFGHTLSVLVSKEDPTAFRIASFSTVGSKQVEAVVDSIIKSVDLQVPPAMEGVQRQLLVNCSVMILQLVEDITSDRRLQVSMLGHSLRIRLEPLPLPTLLEEICEDEMRARRFRVNNEAVDELVDALIDEPEIQQIMVPDFLEAEVYRAALHRLLCIAQFILSQLRIRLFGVEVSLGLVADEAALETESLSEDKVHVAPHELQFLLDRLEAQRSQLKQELHSRQDVSEVPITFEKDPPFFLGEVAMARKDDFQTLAAQDRLSRSLWIQRTVSAPIDVAFEMASDFGQYPTWMPFCISARVTSEERLGRMSCDVNFGVETGAMLGRVGDEVAFQIMLTAPSVQTDDLEASAGKEDILGEDDKKERLRTARVVADTVDGFSVGKRLVYDWRLAELPSGETLVRLDMFFQAQNVFLLPLWDSMQSTIVGVMMEKFIERAAVLAKSREAAQAVAGGPTVVANVDITDGAPRSNDTLSKK